MMFEITRYLLGIVFVLFGLNGFFHWWPLPKMNPQMMKFNDDLMNTKIIMPVVKGFEVVCGALLVINQFTFLATLGLLPICFFVALAHFTFNRPKGIPIGLLFLFFPGVLIHHHWTLFLSILR